MPQPTAALNSSAEADESSASFQARMSSSLMPPERSACAMSAAAALRAREVGKPGRLRIGRRARRRHAGALVRGRHEIAETADDGVEGSDVLERLAAEIGGREDSRYASQAKNSNHAKTVARAFE
jgi:hypothetical protein